MFTTAVTIGVALIGVAVAQDTTPCDSFDITTGIGSCMNITVNIGPVICSAGFDASKCKASKPRGDGSGDIETYFFRGSPPGLPAGPSIQSDCSTDDFPATPAAGSMGLAMAQTYQTAAGVAAGCYPAAGVQGTTLTYTSKFGGTAIGTLSVNFKTHTDKSGTGRDGFIRITCDFNSPTSGFTYTTVGDAGHASQYEIDVEADCSPVPGGSSAPAAEASETGWILIGILCGVSAGYFGGGYVYNWKVKGAEAGERVPQKDFWLGIPGLIKDGFGFVKAKVKKEEYTPI